MLASVLDWAKSLLAGLLDLLPDSPFTFVVPDYIQRLLGNINYFIPIGLMVKTLLAWVVCVGFWYAGVVVMRWIKAIE